LAGSSSAAYPYFFISQSSVRRAIGSPRLLGNSTGEGGCSRSRSQARSALASSGWQRMGPGMAAFEPMHHQPQRAQVEIVCTQQAHLAGAQAVAVGKQEHGTVTHALPRDSEQAAELVESQEADRLGSGRRSQQHTRDYTGHDCPK
jgi:hypothetical protein